jgi:DNA polymerase-3 subunit delta'
LTWLKGEGVQDADSWLSEQGGAPLLAKHQADTGNRDETQALLQLLAHPTIEGALKTAEKLQKAPLSMLVACVQRWLYDVFSCKLAGVIRYYPRHRTELARLAASVPVGLLMGVLKRVSERRAIAEHPLSPKLFIEDMLLDYAACLKEHE